MASHVMKSEKRADFFSVIKMARGLSKSMFRDQFDELYKFT